VSHRHAHQTRKNATQPWQLAGLISVAIWYSIESMGRFELAASIALGLFVSLLIWNLYQVRKARVRRDRQKRDENEC
jgi:hypothetical protein